MKNYYNFITIILLFLLITTMVYIYQIGGVYFEYISNVLYIVSISIAVWFCYKLLKIMGRGISNTSPINYLFYGLIMWFFGEIVFIYMDINQVLDYPTIADGLYLFAYPMFVLAIIRQMTISGYSLSKYWVINVVGFLVVLIYFYIRFRYTSIFDTQVSVSENIFNILYAIADGILVYLASLLVYFIYQIKEGRLFLPWLMILLGFIIYTLADTLYTAYLPLYLDKNWDIRNLDLLWIVAYLVIAFGTYIYIQVVRNAQQKISLKSKINYYAPKP